MAEGIVIQHKNRFLYSSFDGRMWLLALLGIGLGVGVSVIAGQFGWLVLLVFPGLIVLTLAVSRPRPRTFHAVDRYFCSSAKSVAEINGWPGPGRPLFAFASRYCTASFFRVQRKTDAFG